MAKLEPSEKRGRGHRTTNSPWYRDWLILQNLYILNEYFKLPIWSESDKDKDKETACHVVARRLIESADYPALDEGGLPPISANSTHKHIWQKYEQTKELESFKNAARELANERDKFIAMTDDEKKIYVESFANLAIRDNEIGMTDDERTQSREKLAYVRTAQILHNFAKSEGKNLSYLEALDEFAGRSM